jgi:hypothetical protein
VSALVKEVRTDPVVRARFARHFHVSGAYVADYMQKNLVESYVPRTGNYTVYCVGPSGRVYPTVQHLHGGVRVFAMRNGDPVLKWKCGNPMVSYLPVVETATVPKEIVAPSVETIVPTESPTQQVPVETQVAAVPLAAPVYPTLVAPPERTAGFVQTISSSHALSWLPLLIPIPFVHNNTNTNTVPVPTPAPVPEMNSGVGFGVGAIVLVLSVLGSSIVRPRKRDRA